MSEEILLKDVKNEFPQDKSIIFWDTCGLLDLMNFEEKTLLDKVRYISMYENIADAIERGEIVSVSSHLVDFELQNDNYSNVTKKMRDDSKNFLRYLKFFAPYLNLSQEEKDVLMSDTLEVNIEDRLREIINKIIRNTKYLAEEDEHKNFAHNRVVKKQAPSSEKNQSYKDCYIWHSFLRFVEELQPTAPVVAFMTLNKKDFRLDNTVLINDCAILPAMNYYINIYSLYGALIEQGVVPPL